MTEELNRKIDQYNNNPKNEQFKGVSLQYDIDNYQSKIRYLEDLKERAFRKAKTQPNTNFTDFYKQLGLDLKSESQQL